MSTNKYRRRRAMRTPTAGTKYQKEPIQAPLQKVEQSSSFNDLGREDARRIAEQNNPNTRYIDKPTATTSKRQLSDAMSRQQTLIRDAQRQVLGSKAFPQLKPAGSFSARSVPSQSSLVFKEARQSLSSLHQVQIPSTCEAAAASTRHKGRRMEPSLKKGAALNVNQRLS